MIHIKFGVAGHSVCTEVGAGRWS